MKNITWSEIREIVLLEINAMGGPRITRRNSGSWQGWADGSLDEGDDEDEEEDCDEETHLESADRDYLRLMVLEEIERSILEKQEVTYNPTVTGKYERQGVNTNRHGSVVGASDAAEAVQMFIKQQEISQGDYNITCTPAAAKSWTCVGNLASLGREQLITYPDEMPPEGGGTT